MLYRGGVIKLANSPSNFVHETQLTKPPAHTLRFRCDPKAITNQESTFTSGARDSTTRSKFRQQLALNNRHQYA